MSRSAQMSFVAAHRLERVAAWAERPAKGGK